MSQCTLDIRVEEMQILHINVFLRCMEMQGRRDAKYFAYYCFSPFPRDAV